MFVNELTFFQFIGIKMNAETLSERGGFCHFESDKQQTYDCAICVAGKKSNNKFRIKPILRFVISILQIQFNVDHLLTCQSLKIFRMSSLRDNIAREEDRIKFVGAEVRFIKFFYGKFLIYLDIYLFRHGLQKYARILPCKGKM